MSELRHTAVSAILRRSTLIMLLVMFAPAHLALGQTPATAHPEMSKRDAPVIKADRIPPAAVPPVSIDGIRYEVIHWGRQRGLDQDGGYIAAIDIASQKELWTLKLYEVRYQPQMETDVQDVFITGMRRNLLGFGSKLEITDELDRCHVVDPRTRTVTSRP